MSTIQGKAWGQTRCVYAACNVEVHRIEVVAGGFCSEHQHTAKVNRFYVESGVLEVLVWHGDEPDVTRLTAGQMTDVQPNLWHSFKADTAVVAYEIYSSTSNASDIIRRSIGGVDVPALGPILTSIIGVTDDGRAIDGATD